ncbi:MAG: hypothetical protein Q7R94_01485, partial [bacterium]|nr:hypothetical protein [bacterium]
MKKFFSLKLLFPISLFLVWSLFSVHLVWGFTGPPTSTPGAGSGAIGIDAANNLSIGTSTTKADTKLLIVGSSTTSG